MDRETPLWGNFWFALLSASLDGDDVAVEVTTPMAARRCGSCPATSSAELDPGAAFSGAGVGLQQREPRDSAGDRRGRAGQAGRRRGAAAGDRILSVDGEPVETWADLVEAVRNAPDEPLNCESSAMADQTRSIDAAVDRVTKGNASGGSAPARRCPTICSSPTR
jgi:regulator of sigma E protease